MVKIAQLPGFSLSQQNFGDASSATRRRYKEDLEADVRTGELPVRVMEHGVSYDLRSESLIPSPRPGQPLTALGPTGIRSIATTTPMGQISPCGSIPVDNGKRDGYVPSPTQNLWRNNFTLLREDE